MKVKIISPRWPEHSIWRQMHFRFPTLNLATLAALTPEEYDVAIEDENVEDINFDDDTDIAAITAMTPLAPRAYQIADKFRERGKKVVLGGFHATWMPDEAIRHADAVVQGEAEGVWPKALEDLKNNRQQKFYKNSSLPKVSDLIIPRRDLLALKSYFFVNLVQTTRGCPYDCKFCSVTAFYGGTYRFRPIEEIEKEVEGLTGGAGFILFVDDNIVGNTQYARKLFTMLKEHNRKWVSQASVTIADNIELLKLAAESGCYGLFMGFETLNQENLDLMGKPFNKIQKYKDIIAKIHGHGIGVHGSFIFGYDYDDKGVFERLVKFTEDVRLDAAFMPVLTPFPGTEIYRRMEAEGRIIERDWAKYDMEHVVYKPKGMTAEELQEGHDWANKRFYSYPSILKRIGNLRRSLMVFGPMNWDLRKAWRKALCIERLKNP